MEFSEQYLTYDEYKALGGTLDLTPFNLLEFEARRKIDIRTFNRLKRLEKIPQEVKICEYNMINSIQGYNKTLSNISNDGIVKSESTDGYSVSYTTSSEISEIVKSRNSELNDIIDTYLGEVKIDDVYILYRGVE